MNSVDTRNLIKAVTKRLEYLQQRVTKENLEMTLWECHQEMKRLYTAICLTNPMTNAEFEEFHKIATEQFNSLKSWALGLKSKFSKETE